MLLDLRIVVTPGEVVIGRESGRLWGCWLYAYVLFLKITHMSVWMLHFKKLKQNDMPLPRDSAQTVKHFFPSLLVSSCHYNSLSRALNS